MRLIKKNMNIQHRTSNFEHPMKNKKQCILRLIERWTLNVERWKFTFLPVYIFCGISFSIKMTKHCLNQHNIGFYTQQIKRQHVKCYSTKYILTKPL